MVVLPFVKASLSIVFFLEYWNEREYTEQTQKEVDRSIILLRLCVWSLIKSPTLFFMWILFNGNFIYHFSSDKFGIALESYVEMFFSSTCPNLDAHEEFGVSQELGDPTTKRQVA